MKDNTFYVGIDWATEKHAVCLTDVEGKILGENFFEHSGAGLAEMCTWLVDKAGTQDAGAFLVGIETPRGPVVETLLERGMVLHSINPKQSDRFRERFSASGAKDDKRDARVIASALRTDRACFRVLNIDHPLVIQIREWSRMTDDLTEERVRFTHQLRDQLLRYYPQMIGVSSDIASEWHLSLWELAPTPAKAARLTKKKITDLLSKKRVYVVDADKVLAKLQEPPLIVAPGVTEAAQARITMLVKQLRTVNELRKEGHAKLDALCDALGEETEPGQSCEQHDVEILRSLPGLGRIVLAVLLAEAWQLLRARDYQALRNLCGVAPVTQNTGKTAGKRSRVVMRQACNRRLRNAVHQWAEHAIRYEPKSRQAYAELRRRGKTHGHALRSLADRLLKMMCAMLTNQTVYDPTRRTVPLAA